MKYLALIVASLFLGSTYVGEANGDEPKAPSRRVIPNPKFTRPAPQRPSAEKPLPKGFGVPIQRPQGFGKQEWQQKPQQPQQQRVQPRVQTKHSFGFYNYYAPVNPYFRYYRVPTYRHPMFIQPPVIIQPQPLPIYPAPFHGFFFQFRF